MELLGTLHQHLSRISLWAVWAGGFGMLVSAFIVFIEVVGRKLGGVEVLPGFVLPQFRIPGSDEYTGYVFAGATTWAYSYCLIHRSHIRIDALYNLLAMPVRAVLDVVGLVLLGVYVALLTERAWLVFVESIVKASVSATPQLTPLWIPQVFWVTGLTLFLITNLFLIVHASAHLIRGQFASVQKLAGTMSVQEEVADSTRGVSEMSK